jgi:hypothetical protein
MSSNQPFGDITSKKKSIREQCVKRTILCVTAASALLLPRVSRADFKYTKCAKFTGGARAGLIKFAASVAGKGTDPTVRLTTSREIARESREATGKFRSSTSTRVTS